MWYLSFAGSDGWLGACVVPASDVVDAARVAHRRGCNPGGQVAGVPVNVARVPEEFVGVLLTLDDVASLDLLVGGSGKTTRVTR